MYEIEELAASERFERERRRGERRGRMPIVPLAEDLGPWPRRAPFIPNDPDVVHLDIRTAPLPKNIRRRVG